MLLVNFITIFYYLIMAKTTIQYIKTLFITGISHEQVLNSSSKLLTLSRTMPQFESILLIFENLVQLFPLSAY